jgi:uncharacterized protein
MRIGEINTLKILRGTGVGFYLGDEEGNDVLLPKKYIPDDKTVGDDIDVFIYKDSEDRIIATNLTPAAKVGEIACMRVAATSPIGAFMEWGLEKDLLVPFREQNHKLQPDEWAIIYVYLDEITQRLVGSTKLHKFFENDENIPLTPDQEVNLILYEHTEIGFKAVINNKYRGMIYHNEIFQTIGWGDTVKAYVKEIRPDFLVDCSLQPLGHRNIEPNAQKILQKLKENEGTVSLSDASSPYEIQTALEMSKKNFKKAVGQLYKQRLIAIETDKIRLLPEGSSNQE